MLLADHEDEDGSAVLLGPGVVAGLKQSQKTFHDALDASLLPGLALGGDDGLLSHLQSPARHQPHAGVLLACHQKHLRFVLIDTHTRGPPDEALLVYKAAAATAHTLALGGQAASTVGVALAQALAGPEITALGR